MRKNNIYFFLIYIFNKFKSLVYIKSFLSSLIFYKLGLIIEKRNIDKKLIIIKKHYEASRDKQIIVNKANLIKQLNYVQNNIPYYSEIFKKIKFKPSSLEKDIGYFNEIPIINKKIINENRDKFINADLLKNKFFEVKSSGSTGGHFKLLYDLDAADFSAAITRFARSKNNIKDFNTKVNFASSHSEDEYFSKEDLKSFALNRNNIFFNDFSDKSINKIINRLKIYKPYVVHGHPSTLYFISLYAQSNNIDLLNVFSVFESSGETLFDYQKNLITKVFGCRVLNRYGLAEFGIVAYQNGNNNVLKVFDSEVYIENNTNNELIFTSLRNTLNPLIRYDSGDIGELFYDEDYIYIKNLQGRIHDFVIINGINFPTHRIMDLFDHTVIGISEFQIIRKHNKLYKFLLVPKNKDVSKEAIKNVITNSLGGPINIEFTSLNKLKRKDNNSKFRHIFDE